MVAWSVGGAAAVVAVLVGLAVWGLASQPHPPVSATPLQPLPGEGAAPPPVYVPGEAIPANDGGSAEVFRASGRGPWETPDFTLRNGTLQGITVLGGDGVWFYLVHSGSSFDPSAPTLAGCVSPCQPGTWVASEPVAPGSYYIHVDAGPTTQWQLQLDENVTAPPGVVTTGGAASGTFLRANGTGNLTSKAFRLSLAPGAAEAPAPNVAGSLDSEGPATFYLVPAGKALDPDRDLMYRSEGAGNGGWSGTLSGSGSYRLVVRTKGTWSFDLTP